IIDAMDILYSGKVEGFCLATSDSDFTKLASRLRESGVTVIGMGENKTPRPFVLACDEFKFIDKLAKEASVIGRKQMKNLENTVQTGNNKSINKDNSALAKTSEETSQTGLATICETIVNLINDNSDEEGYMLLSDVGITLSKRYADFDVRNFGFTKMVPFIKSLEQFEIKSIKNPDNKRFSNSQIAYIKIK
ncbi:MAG: NYN domain-containing protein, partial [Clostridia bacterium]